MKNNPVRPSDKNLALMQENIGSIEGTRLTTQFGVGIRDNHYSLNKSSRSPTLIEDFIGREKITHFDRERVAMVGDRLMLSQQTKLSPVGA